jgi:hypothetical protein
MIYIGDLSKNDVALLSNAAAVSTRILEFGVGASTQIFRRHSPGELICVETSRAWVDTTIKNLQLLGINGKVTFHKYDSFKPEGEYDLIFDDGHDALRLPFALAVWKHLKVGGHLLWHDTRRHVDIYNICTFIAAHWSEITTIEFNKGDSNISVMTKGPPCTYLNWNMVENKPGWMTGAEKVNEEELAKLLKDQNRN